MKVNMTSSVASAPGFRLAGNGGGPLVTEGRQALSRSATVATPKRQSGNRLLFRFKPRRSLSGGAAPQASAYSLSPGSTRVTVDSSGLNLKRRKNRPRLLASGEPRADKPQNTVPE